MGIGLENRGYCEMRIAFSDYVEHSPLKLGSLLLVSTNFLCKDLSRYVGLLRPILSIGTRRSVVSLARFLGRLLIIEEFLCIS